MDYSIPNTLYQYCSIDTFYNIVSEKYLRFGSINHFRDLKERQHFLEAHASFMASGNLKSKPSEITEKDVEEFFNDNLYVACFSEKSDVLSQWSVYGSDGVGISVGYNRDFFETSDVIPFLLNTCQ